VGTRPDTIKSAPVVQELRRYDDRVETLLVATGQHREMMDQALDTFGLTADYDLAVMRHGQTLAEVTIRCLEGLDRLIAQLEPRLVMAQGDTTTTFVAALAAFYRRVPFAHIEAGLRTATVANPFPEEFNRRAVGQLATQHYAPTPLAAQNLLHEGAPPETVFVTGNSGIDAVIAVAERRPQTWFQGDPRRVVLLTTHRRENWGDNQVSIARAACRLVERFDDVLLVVSLHRNPLVRETLRSALGEHDRIRLIEPPEYPDFVKLMQRSVLILTDSGGIQEEAPAFGLPVLVLRESTERPEGVDSGTTRLVGTSEEAIFAAASELLTDRVAYERMARSASPYGDGRAAARIRYQALRLLGVDSPEEAMWG
jgi:UDP-N-acetylglucosamine 2-epimerase